MSPLWHKADMARPCWRIDGSLMIHSRHETPAFAAMHGPDLLYF